LYVQSGLYDFSNKKFRMWKQFEFQKRLRNDNSGLSNGSLFSYIFLDKKKIVIENVVEPTKTSTFRGTFYIACTMLSFSALAFILELWGYLLLRRLWKDILAEGCKFYRTGFLWHMLHHLYSRETRK